jgi:alanine-glyoxylate transaminase/serine-glyoxylate transaminase/serine-pyruvate transaminase
MAILAVSPKAREANRTAKCARYFWDWAPVFERNARGEFPYTPATALIFGLKESLAMLEEEGLPNVFARHARLAESCRRAVNAMELKLLAKNIKEASNTLTAVCMPEGFDSDAYLAHAQKTLELPLGPGLGAVKGKIFRIGHLGSLNELELLGALAGVEMTLTSFGVAIPLGAGLAAAETYLLQTAPGGPGKGQ